MTKNVKTYSWDSKPDITKNQQLVYHYILDKCSFNRECKLYEVASSEIIKKKMADELHIGVNTVTRSFKVLIEKGYLKFRKDPNRGYNEYYQIDPYMEPYCGIDFRIIKILVKAAAHLQENSKHVVSVYTTLCRYYKKEGSQRCYMTAANLAKVYEKNTNYEKTVPQYFLLLALFISLGLIKGEWVEKYANGKDGGIKLKYLAIDYICFELPKNIDGDCCLNGILNGEADAIIDKKLTEM